MTNKWFTLKPDVDNHRDHAMCLCFTFDHMDSHGKTLYVAENSRSHESFSTISYRDPVEHSTILFVGMCCSYRIPGGTRNSSQSTTYRKTGMSTVQGGHRCGRRFDFNVIEIDLRHTLRLQNINPGSWSFWLSRSVASSVRWAQLTVLLSLRNIWDDIVSLEVDSRPSCEFCPDECESHWVWLSSI